LLFYNPTLESLRLLELSEEESWHAVKVLRLGKGATFQITDGRGGLAQARIIEPHAKKCIVQLTDFKRIESGKNYSIHLAVALPKSSERIDWLIEKCVEIGIEQLSFVLTDHSERQKLNTERLMKKALAAMKQSLQLRLPQFNTGIGLKDFVNKCTDQERFIAHVDEGNEVTLFKSAAKAQNYCILIGPEGDFSKEEVALAIEKGFRKVSLGRNRLRVETAALAACLALQLLNE
jgi:16S rRNA (uracil1498-N3)-methyltransferase